MSTRLIMVRNHRINGSRATGAHPVGCLLNTSLAVIWLCAGISRGTDVSAKLPVPDAASQKASKQLIDEIYGKQVRAAMTREGKSALAKKLLDTSHDEKDSAGRYVLLNMSKDLAADGGDADAALAAVAELDRTYAINTIAVRAETLRAAAKNAGTSATRKAALNATIPLFDDAVAADRFEIAKPLGELALVLAKKENDAASASDLQRKLSELAQSEQAFSAAKDALAVLKETPKDPAASAAVGKYLCFFKGEWDRGLPMLAIGNDPNLQLMAKTEIARVTTSDRMINLADAWFDYAKKQTGGLKNGALQRARRWYEGSAVGLSGLSKLKVDKRLGDIAALSPRHVIDLLRLVDPPRDAMLGSWRVENGKLLTDGGGDMELRFGYHPPAEYDYIVDYFREDGHLGTALLFTRLDALCVLSLPSDAHATFAMGPPEGQSGNRFEATIPHLEGGSRIKIQVRNDGLTVFVNGLKIIDHRMPDWKAPPLPSWMLSGGPTAVGIIGFYGRITIKSAEIVEISGPGTMLH